MGRYVVIAVAVLTINVFHARHWAEAQSSFYPAIVLIKGGFNAVTTSSTLTLKYEIEKEIRHHGLLELGCHSNETNRNPNTVPVCVEILDNVPYLFAKYDKFKKLSENYEPYSHLVIIGHSLGGEVAYKLAKLLIDEGKSVFLITLDPTSLPPHWYRDVSGSNRWKNIHIRRFISTEVLHFALSATGYV